MFAQALAHRLSRVGVRDRSAIVAVVALMSIARLGGRQRARERLIEARA